MSDHHHVDDAVLIHRIKQRDQQALAALYAAYSQRVYNLCMHIVRDRVIAEEVMQDVFMRIWRYPEKWDSTRGSLDTWLLLVTRHYAIDRLRRENRQPLQDAHSLEQINHRVGKHSIVDDTRWDNGRLLRQLLKTLPKTQRTVIHLAFFRGMTHTEIAEHLNLPLGTIKSRIRLGLDRLRKGWAEAQAEEQTAEQLEP